MAKTKTTEHSPQYEKYAKRYARGGCTKAQLHRLVELCVLTAAEYEEITGDPYDG